MLLIDMKKVIQATKTLCLVIITVIGIVLFVSIFNHRIQLNDEASLYQPKGDIVQVYGHSMHVYEDGKGEHTLVFLSGGGTSSPLYDFKSLSSLLSEDNKIVVVEKLGYGYSEIADVDRDIHSMLRDTREALFLAGHQPPYVLIPHSMSGLEALNWAQLYPNEVKGIIGLDMAVPASYNDFTINMPMIRLAKFAADIGLTRLIPGIQNSDAIKYGTLSEAEKEQARSIFYRRTATRTMINEINAVKQNAKIVGAGKNPEVPILLFSSNGEETGFAPDEWIRNHVNFIEQTLQGELVALDVPHYVHNYAYDEIAEYIKQFLIKLKNEM